MVEGGRRRRTWLLLTPSLLAAAAGGAAAKPLPAHASLGDAFWPALPRAVRAPRTSLTPELARTLMRSLYASVDDVDVVPMQTFQELFWKARAKLQPEYTRIIEPLRVRRVGDLADPLYFDFVSGVQMKEAERAIAKAIDEGFVAYEERVCPPSPDGDPSCPLEAMESKRVVSHPGPELWAAFEGRLGERILTGLAREGNDLGEATVAGQGASREQIEERVRALCGVLRSQGYALKVDVRSESLGPGEGNRLVVTWFAGCSLWGAQYCGVGPKSTKGLPAAFLSVAALAGGKAKGGGVGGLSLGTAFDAYAIRALLLRMGAKNVAVAAYADGDASEMVTQVTWGAQA